MAEADAGVYRTPRRASGTSVTMISALKTTAERIADCGEDSRITLSASSVGKAPANMAGRIAKYLARSLAMEKVVSDPRVISSCLPIATISMSFVGLESRSTMLPASFAAVVPVFIATPTSAWARAGASLVPSPVMATSRPPSCSRRMRASLSSGVASASTSSTPASSAIARAVRSDADDGEGEHAAQVDRPALLTVGVHAHRAVHQLFHPPVPVGGEHPRHPIAQRAVHR